MLWIAVIISGIVGLSIIVMHFSNPGSIENNFWRYGLLLIFLVYVICLGLFIIRGYYMWCMIGDPATHIGWINQILSTGYTPPSLIYPALHIFLSEISLFTTLSPVSLHKIIPLFFCLICIVFFYMFVRVLSNRQIEPVIAVIISCILLSQVSL